MKPMPDADENRRLGDKAAKPNNCHPARARMRIAGKRAIMNRARIQTMRNSNLHKPE